MVFAVYTRAAVCCFPRAATRAEQASCRTTSLSWRGISFCRFLTIVAWFPTAVNPYAPICSLHVQSPGVLYRPWSRRGPRPCGHWNMCVGSLRCSSGSNRHPSWRTVPADPDGRRCKFNILVMPQRLTGIGVNCCSVELNSCRAGGNGRGHSALWELVQSYMHCACGSTLYHSCGHTRYGFVYSPLYKFPKYFHSDQDHSGGHLQI